MKSLGIIGGIGSESTVIYYRSIIREFKKLRGETGNPSILINSIDNDKLLALVAALQFDQLVDYLLSEVRRLVAGDASIALLAANTPHLVYPRLQDSVPIRLISVVEATAAAATRLGLRRVALFGTRFTMAGEFYPEAFRKMSLDIVKPNASEQSYIHEKYMSELLKGIVSDDTRQALIGIATNLKERDGLDGVVLGGTELSLLFPIDGGQATPVPFLDTTDIHSKAAVAELVALGD